MADYKKEGKIGDILLMERDGSIFEAGIVTDFKNGKIITEDFVGKKHQYAEDNKKIAGFKSFDDIEIHDEPASIADTAPVKPSDASISSSKEKDDDVIKETTEAIPEVFMGIVDTQKPLLNIRADADKNSKIIGKLRKGDEVKLTGEGSWYKLSDRDGYVAADYIKRA